MDLFSEPYALDKAKRYEIIRTVGRGAFGEVSRVSEHSPSSDNVQARFYLRDIIRAVSVSAEQYMVILYVETSHRGLFQSRVVLPILRYQHQDEHAAQEQIKTLHQTLS